MKKIKKLASLLCLTLMVISCSKNNEEIQGKLIEKKSISAKWEISNSNYKSLEFNKDGNYIIVKSSTQGKNTLSKNNDGVLFGEYTIVNETTINLIGFGKILISSINDTEMNFTIVDDKTATSIEVNSTKILKIDSSTSTDLLCRTWKMVEVDNENVKGTEYELTVIFSQAGTYFVELQNPTEEVNGGLAEWKWKDASENTMCYSWDGEPTCTEEDGLVSITNLTENNLTIVETKYGETNEYKLEVVTDNTSAKTHQKNNTKNISLKKGIFKNN